MKALIVICVIVVLLQVASFGVSFTGNGADQANAQSVEDGSLKPNAENFPLAAGFQRFLDPYRPRITLPWDELSVPFGGTQAIVFSDGAKRQMTKFELTGGSGMMISYDCGDRDRCSPQFICLCPPGAPVSAMDFLVCGKAKPRDGVCADQGNIGLITVYGDTGTIHFDGLGQAGGIVRQL